jgi:hypothetical protein
MFKVGDRVEGELSIRVREEDDCSNKASSRVSIRNWDLSILPH